MSWARQILGERWDLERKILKEGWSFNSRERERCGRKWETGRDQFWGRLLDSWMQLEEITFFQQPPELSSLPGSRDYLGTDAEKVTFRHRLSVVNYAIISALQTSATRGWWSASL